MNHLEEVRRLPSVEYGAKNDSLHSEATADHLSRLAHVKVLAALRRYGNQISPTHNLALLELSQALSRQALRIRPGRFAYAMPCGAGKTQSVVAWVAAAHELGLELSVAISAFQIRALSSIKLDLMAAGVPESKIGFRHSLGSDDKLLPDTGDEDRPVMLVSHARIRGQRESSLFSLHRGRKRDLLIWDESLMTADAQLLSWLDVKGAIERVLAESEGDSPLVHGLSVALLKMQSALEAQRHGEAPKAIELFDALKMEGIQEEARRLRSGGATLRSAAVKTVRTLTTMAAHPVSLALTGHGASGDGLIRYTVAV